MVLEYYKNYLKLLFILALTSLNVSCQEDSSKAADIKDIAMLDLDQDIIIDGRKPKIAKIDFSHWKLTLPVSNNKGKLIEIDPPEILDYATNKVVKPIFIMIQQMHLLFSMHFRMQQQQIPSIQEVS